MQHIEVMSSWSGRLHGMVAAACGLSVAAGLRGATAGPARADSPTLTLRPSSGQRGDSVTFDLGGFDAGARFHLTEDGNTIGNAVGPMYGITDSGGAFEGSVGIDHNDSFG